MLNRLTRYWQQYMKSSDLYSTVIVLEKMMNHMRKTVVPETWPVERFYQFAQN